MAMMTPLQAQQEQERMIHMEMSNLHARSGRSLLGGLAATIGTASIPATAGAVGGTVAGLRLGQGTGFIGRGKYGVMGGLLGYYGIPKVVNSLAGY